MRTLLTLPGGGAVLTELKPIQNKSRNKTPVQNRQDLVAWLAAHPPEERRLANPVLVCPKCENSKRGDGSDGLGGFSPNPTRTNGWSWICKWCAKRLAKERRCNTSMNRS